MVRESGRERIFWWALIAAFGLLQLRAEWHAANPDGVSYLDLASRFRDGHLDLSAIAYWSPGYPLVIAVMQLANRSSVLDAFGVAHVTNFVLWLIAFVSFRWLVRELQNLAKGKDAELVRSSLFRAVGYSIFIWSGLRLISLGLITPDLFVAAIVYGIAAAVVRFETAPRSLKSGLLLGALLGAGYWIKAVLFPLEFALLAAMFARRIAGRVPLRGVAAALVTFLTVAAPLMIAISREEGRITFSAVARLNHAWYLDAVRGPIHWQGSPSTGVAVHPTRQLLGDPDVYEFRQPFTTATYPPWYAPPWWHRGLNVETRLEDQLRALGNTGEEYLGIARADLPEFLALVLLGARAWKSGRTLWPVPILLFWCLTALGLYSLVHVESRFVAPFITVSAVAAFACVRTTLDRRWAKLLPVAARLLILLLLGRTLVATVVDAAWPSSTLKRHRQVAAALHRAGVVEGDAVASIGNSFNCYWAHLAGARIVAEVPQASGEAFSKAHPEVQTRVYDLFSSSGAKAVVSSESSPQKGSEWTQVPTTDYGIRILEVSEK